MSNRYFYNGSQVSEKVAKGLFERGANQAGYDTQEVRDIWEQACEATGEEFRDMLVDFSIEIQITH